MPAVGVVMKNALGLVVILAALLPGAVHAKEIHGAGATFPFPLYERWASAYKAETGVTIRYEPNGSGLGIKLVKARSVTFGGSDMPLKAGELAEGGLLQFPTVIGGDVPVVNIPGIKAGALVLSGAALAGIYLGRITSWSDPTLQKLNPTLKLPALPITVIHRSDGSGTTFVWTDYLSKSSKEWADGIGSGIAVDWPVGVGARGNEGVASNVAQLSGAIGYVEYTYATQMHLAHTLVINRAGRAVAPSAESFRAAADSVDWAHAPLFYAVLTDQPGEMAWPIAGATFILMPKNPSDPAASADALRFFKWAYSKGDDIALRLNYVPLSDSVVSLIEASWSQIKH